MGPCLIKHPPEGDHPSITLVQAGCLPCSLPACPFPSSWPQKAELELYLCCLINTELSCTRRTLILLQNPPVSPAWTGKTHPDAFLRNNLFTGTTSASTARAIVCREEAVVLSCSLSPGSCNSWRFPQAAAAAVAGELPQDVLGCSMPLARLSSSPHFVPGALG